MRLLFDNYLNGILNLVYQISIFIGDVISMIYLNIQMSIVIMI